MIHELDDLSGVHQIAIAGIQSNRIVFCRLNRHIREFRNETYCLILQTRTRESMNHKLWLGMPRTLFASSSYLRPGLTVKQLVPNLYIGWFIEFGSSSDEIWRSTEESSVRNVWLLTSLAILFINWWTIVHPNMVGHNSRMFSRLRDGQYPTKNFYELRVSLNFLKFLGTSLSIFEFLGTSSSVSKRRLLLFAVPAVHLGGVPYEKMNKIYQILFRCNQSRNLITADASGANKTFLLQTQILATIYVAGDHRLNFRLWNDSGQGQDVAVR